MGLRWVVAGLLTLGVACDGDGFGGDGSGSSSSGPTIYDARVACDPTASVWDDLFIFEAETSTDAVKVTVEIWNGSSNEGTRNLSETSSGDWYEEVDADDIDSDCDDWSSMNFEFVAEDASGDEDTEQVKP